MTGLTARGGDDAQHAGYAPMPELGTIRECVFCHFMVTLREVRGGWFLWTADRDRLDGRWHCDGGQPGNRHTGVTLTLHIPVPPPDGAPWAPRYDPDGIGHHPQNHDQTTRRLA